MQNIKIVKNTEIQLELSALTLKIITPDDVTESYINWLNDYEVVKYTEQKFIKHTLSTVKEFVSEKLNSSQDLLFGIYHDKRHIGNIKLGPANERHNVTDLSYFIGERDMWGKGIATSAIKGVVKIAFEELGLEKVTAGTYENNIGSIHALLKNNFIEEGRRVKQLIFDGYRIDHVLFGKLK